MRVGHAAETDWRKPSGLATAPKTLSARRALGGGGGGSMCECEKARLMMPEAAGVGGGATARAAVRGGHAAQAADAAAGATGVAAAVGHEAEDAAEGRHGGVDAALDAAPGVLEPDEVVHAELDGIHLVEAHLDRVDDGGAGDPGVGDGVLGVRRLGFDQADGGVGGLVDGVVAISRCCDASTRSSDLRDSRLLPALNIVDFALS